MAIIVVGNGITCLKGSLAGAVEHKLLPCRRRIMVCRCSWSSSSQATRSSRRMMDPYTTLGIQPGASESEVRKAFRQLALQYHPDVCKESKSGVQFHLINEAYDAVMNNLREEQSSAAEILQTQHGGVAAYEDEEDAMRGMFDPEYEMWEEWMGWEGAGIRDYSSHINPFI